MQITGYILTVLVGISLGLIGSGGSVLTIPILVYLFAFSPELATTYSLFIVGIAAAVAAVKYYRQQQVQTNLLFYFNIPAILAILVVRNFILPIVPNNIFTLQHFTVSKKMFFMLLFALLMVITAVSMIGNNGNKNPIFPQQKNKLIGLGFMVGIVTGLLGAGGGFIIVPALLFFGRTTLKKAIGTSLVIVAINSTIGFVNDVVKGIQINYIFLLTATAFSITGILIGSYLSTKINGAVLKPLFGWIILIIGFFIITTELLTLH